MTMATWEKTKEGSPPRVRGTVVKGLVKCLGVRITPACAGNSPSRRYKIFADWDHPRVCGEQQGRLPRDGHLLGSPPRVRGTAGSHSVPALWVGITPACAGNSCSCPRSWRRYKDHPRVCGEQTRLLSGLKWRGGSPPRVRGTVPPHFRQAFPHGITPACAGNSIREGERA